MANDSPFGDSIKSELPAEIEFKDDIEAEVLFSIEIWAGLPKYVCAKCGKFDTLDVNHMYKHIDEDHYERQYVIPVVESTDNG